LPLKRLTTIAVSLLFFVACRTRRALSRLIGWPVAGTCTVLYYHAVRPEHRGRFARQMDTLLRCAKSVRADRREPLSPGTHNAAVTFDDGYENVIYSALPELSARGIPFTWFIVSDALGKPAPWLKDTSQDDRILSREQLKALPADLVTVGSHTVTHPRLPELKDEDAWREISDSRANLERFLEREVKLFSFPYGEYNAMLIEKCRQAGYERVFTILPTPALSDSRQFVTGRVSVEPTDWPLEFRLKLSGAYSWLPTAFSLKRKTRQLRRGIRSGEAIPRQPVLLPPDGDDDPCFRLTGPK